MIWTRPQRSEEHTSELQSHVNLVCRLLLEKKKASFAWLGTFIWENGPLLIGCACFASALFVFFGSQVTADSWLNVLGGREIVQHGLPHHDQLAIVSHGRPWVDQQ